MFEEERKQKIIDFVLRHRRASVQDLTAYLHVSESTVRRDLSGLEEANLLRRTHGGAVALGDNNIEPPFTEKEDRYRSQKKAIAQAALSLITEGDIIILDAGTTTYHLAQLLKVKGFNKLTVVTNSLVAAQELADQKGIELVLTGGSLRQETLAMVGPLAEQALGSVRVHKTFLAMNDVDPVFGLTTPNMIEAAAKRCMIRSAQQVILLADYSKYGTSSFAKVAELADIDKWITSENMPSETVERMQALGIDITITHAGSDQ